MDIDKLTFIREVDINNGTRISEMQPLNGISNCEINVPIEGIENYNGYRLQRIKDGEGILDKSIGEKNHEDNFDNDINIEDEERRQLIYNELCNNCMIKDIVGCKGCGIYQYAIVRNEYKITIRRTE